MILAAGRAAAAAAAARRASTLPPLPFDAAAVLASVPPTAYAFAYGSGAVPQAGRAASSSAPPMVDFIFAVDDPRAWHAANLARNASHYAWAARAAGARAVAAVQESAFGARLWYNTLVPLPGGARAATMKYGVISAAALAEDLLEWRHLYAAGRLHKPVLELAGGARAPLAAARAANARAALRAALLLLPARFAPRDLFRAVAALSYRGDWRMTFGEAPRKVDDIVDGALPAFAALYAPLLAAPPFAAAVAAAPGAPGAPAALLLQDDSPAARAALGMRLPLSIQRAMARAAGFAAAGAEGAEEARAAGGGSGGAAGGSAGDAAAGAAAGDIDEARAAAAERDPRLRALWAAAARAADPAGFVRRLLKPAVAAVVAPAARGQALTGIVTAGPEKAALYAAAKLRKFFAALRAPRLKGQGV
jgi:translocator assembly and maintenance protein 41